MAADYQYLSRLRHRPRIKKPWRTQVSDRGTNVSAKADAIDRFFEKYKRLKAEGNFTTPLYIYHYASR